MEIRLLPENFRFLTALLVRELARLPLVVDLLAIDAHQFPRARLAFLPKTRFMLPYALFDANRVTLGLRNGIAHGEEGKQEGDAENGRRGFPQGMKRK